MSSTLVDEEQPVIEGRALSRFISRPSAPLHELLRAARPEFSPVPIWWWSGDRLELDRLRWQLDRMLEAGIHQAIVLNLAPSGPLYGALADEPAFATDEWWLIFRGVCDHARERGFSIWFYDQLGFSGADLQGRLVGEHPSMRGERLELITSQDAAIELPPGAVVLAAWMAGADGAITSIAAQTALSPAALDPGATLSLAVALPHGFDYFSATACAALLSSVHGELARRMPDHLGSTIVGSFQDELPSMPTWSRGFLDEFHQRRGYRLEDELHALWHSTSASSRVRGDYQRTRAELAEEAFFAPLARWHEEHGLAAGCDQQHPARAGYPIEATQQYADYQRTHRWFSAPGCDHWGEAKLHSSLAHLYDHPRTWVEAFHTTGWGGTIEETFDWLVPWLRAGATLFNPHAVYYSTRDSRWEWAPPSTCWRQPYWRHYRLFADAVAMLCAALSWGEHVCDVAVLFPGATARAHLDLGLGEELLGHPLGVMRSHDDYLAVVGKMHWYAPEPGALDRDCRDFDVLDDDSLAQAKELSAGFQIGRERYRALVLPSCAVLEQGVADAVVRVAASSTVVVVGDLPEDERIRALVEQGAIIAVDSAADLASALSGVERTVESELPTLMRTKDEDTIVLVTGAHPSATLPAPGARWREEGYTFSASRYSRTQQIRIPGAGSRPAAIWDPSTGTARRVQLEPDGAIAVELDRSPCALLVVGPSAELLAEEHSPTAAGATVTLTEWEGELLPTLDNQWGDIDAALAPGQVPVRIWSMETAEDPHGPWRSTLATFGPRGERSLPYSDQPSGWVALEYSPTLGLRAGHSAEEPKGFIAEEFLDLGQVAHGERVAVRLWVQTTQAGDRTLRLGAAAARSVRWNGEPVGEAASYYSRHPVRTRVGLNLLELELVPDTMLDLRASWCFDDGVEPLGPQWLASDEATTASVALPDEPLLVQLGTIGRVWMSVDGVEVASHGEFDNYEHRAQPRVRRYTVSGAELTVQLAAGSGFALDAVSLADDSVRASSGPDWGEGLRLVAAPHDPRWMQLRPRTHPLATEDAVGVLADGPAEQHFRFRLPPGACALRLSAYGEPTVRLGGTEVPGLDGVWRFAQPVSGGELCLVSVQTEPGLVGGAVWRSAPEVELRGGAPVPLGDWTALGLADYSGGLTYRSVLPAGAGVLSLGEVRGSAQVRVGGVAAGARAWSPYDFQIPAGPEGRTVEVDVFNTLAPQMAAVSPTPWVLEGQLRSGLIGPVTFTQMENTAIEEVAR